MYSLYSRSNGSLCVSIVFCLCIFQLCCRTTSASRKQPPKEKVTAVYAFGDSIVDPGNNNEITTIIKCNFPPYGRDFPDQKATGRFCNGRIPTDFISDQLGVKKYLPAFLDPSLQQDDLLTGVSFASSGCGYDPMTPGLTFAKSLRGQLRMFKDYIRKVTEMVGVERTNFILNNSITIVVAGSDDFALTYFSTPFRRTTHDPDSYTDLMLNSTRSFLRKLYNLRVRKISVANVAPIGYLPSQRTLGGGPTRESPEHYNQAVDLFNNKLRAAVVHLSTLLRYSKLVYMDVNSIMLDLILNKTHYGFEVVDTGCCGSGLIEVSVLCNSFSLLCTDKKHLFWDSFHPTEDAYEIISTQVVEKYISQLF